MASRPLGERLQNILVETWWSPRRRPLALLLWPLSLLYDGLRRISGLVASAAWSPPCPVIVVGNLVVGGAGKTPTVIALVRTLAAAGYRPGVVSRGYGRRLAGVSSVEQARDSREVGDEPWLIHRATAAPVVVAERRADAAKALLAAHPDVDVLVSDDGLQHHRLARDAELWIFDERGVGNGWLLPAGPLRQPLPTTVPPNVCVLYNAASPSTALPGALMSRHLSGAADLRAWHTGAPMEPSVLTTLRGRRLLALAGIGSPARFFTMLRDYGLDIEAMPLADHADFAALPWPPGSAEVVCTEKDAAKLDPDRCEGTQVWVVGLDLQLPPELMGLLRPHIAPPRST